MLFRIDLIFLTDTPNDAYENQSSVSDWFEINLDENIQAESTEEAEAIIRADYMGIDCDGVGVEWTIVPVRCECGCGCDNLASEENSEGDPVCSECITCMVDDGGNVVCGDMTDGFTRCHVCREKINWGSIVTGNSPGAGSTRDGECGCGDAWICKENGGAWDDYSYAEEADCRNYCLDCGAVGPTILQPHRDVYLCAECHAIDME